MNYKDKCKAIEKLLDKIGNSDDQCYIALYLHRVYLNFENLAEYYLAKNRIIVEHDGSYHKMMLTYFVNDIAKNGFGAEELYILLDELRGFRHIFVKRSDIWCFDGVRLNALKHRLLKHKDGFSRLLEETFYEI